MDIDNAASFLVGSILFGIGFCAISIAFVFVNNIFSKYWKPVKIWMPSYMSAEPQRFATDEEMQRITPTLDKKDKKD